MKRLAALLLAALALAARAEDPFTWHAPLKDELPSDLTLQTDTPLANQTAGYLLGARPRWSEDRRRVYLDLPVTIDGAEATLRYYPELRSKADPSSVRQEELLVVIRADKPPMPVLQAREGLALIGHDGATRALTLGRGAGGPTLAVGASVNVPAPAVARALDVLRRAGTLTTDLPTAPAPTPVSAQPSLGPGDEGWTPPAELLFAERGGRKGYMLDGGTLYYVRGDGTRVKAGYLSELNVRGTRDKFQVLAVAAPDGSQVAYSLSGSRIAPWNELARRNANDIWLRPVEGGRDVPLMPLTYDRHGTPETAIDSEGQRYEVAYSGGRGVFMKTGSTPVAVSPGPAAAPAATHPTSTSPPSDPFPAQTGPTGILVSGPDANFHVRDNTLYQLGPDGETKAGQVMSLTVGGNMGQRRVILYAPEDKPREEWGYYTYGTTGKLTRLGGVDQLGTRNVWSRPVVDENGQPVLDPSGRPYSSVALIPFKGTHQNTRMRYSASIELKYVDPVSGDFYDLDLSGRVGVFRRTAPPPGVRDEDRPYFPRPPGGDLPGTQPDGTDKGSGGDKGPKRGPDPKRTGPVPSGPPTDPLPTEPDRGVGKADPPRKGPNNPPNPGWRPDDPTKPPVGKPKVEPKGSTEKKDAPLPSRPMQGPPIAGDPPPPLGGMPPPTPGDAMALLATHRNDVFPNLPPNGRDPTEADILPPNPAGGPDYQRRRLAQIQFVRTQRELTRPPMPGEAPDHHIRRADFEAKEMKRIWDTPPGVTPMPAQRPPDFGPELPLPIPGLLPMAPTPPPMGDQL